LLAFFAAVDVVLRISGISIRTRAVYVSVAFDSLWIDVCRLPNDATSGNTTLSDVITGELFRVSRIVHSDGRKCGFEVRVSSWILYMGSGIGVCLVVLKQKRKRRDKDGDSRDKNGDSR
jgi:hypothetical protein